MKLVIQTQIKENYGAHDWDGKGTCPQYWKFKGGNTYVVLNLTPEQAMKVGKTGIPTLTALIECKSEAWEEYIIDWSIEDNDAKVCEDWETPIEFYWGGDRWLARATQENDEFGYMRGEILRKHEEWIPLEGSERAHYKATYDMVDGTTVPYSELAEWFDSKETA